MPADPDCVFCGIVAGAVEATIVDADERTVSFMDINPVTRGHALVIPREHSQDIHDIPAEDLIAVTRAAQRLARRARPALGADGVNLLNFSGRAAWQTVFHVHLHVIPRYEDDPLRLQWVPGPGDPEDITAAGALLRRPQVRLVQATLPLLEALREDRTRLGALLGSPAPDGWPEFPEAIDVALEHLRTAPEADHGWSMQFFVDAATGRLLGSGGFVAPPGDRTVEIGYEIAPAFRGRGFGSAAARALVERAVEGGEVDHVIAHTLPGPNPSTGLLVSLGFEHVGERADAELGTIWAWRWTRPGVE